jgi:glycosyltransferase involved in cell wall biosynthesis
MKIAFLIRKNVYTLRGGDTVQLDKTINYLSNHGVECYVNPIRTIDDKFDIVHIFNVQDPWLTSEQIHEWRNENIPIVLSPIYWDTSYLNESLGRDLVRALIRQPRTPLALTPLNLISRFKTAKDRWLLTRWCLESVDLLLPNSIAELEGLVNAFKAIHIRKKSIIVFNGVDDSWFLNDFEKLTTHENRTGVICVGRIDPSKGQYELIKSFLQTDLPRLTIVGYPYNSKYYRECVSLGGADRVRFIEEVEHSEIIELYDQHRVHCLLSVRESPGLVSLEAFARGCSLVVTENCPLNEYFTDIALVANRNSIDSIAKALSRQHSINFAKNFKFEYKHFSENFLWSSISKKTYNAYQKLLTHWQ